MEFNEKITVETEYLTGVIARRKNFGKEKLPVYLNLKSVGRTNSDWNYEWHGWMSNMTAPPWIFLSFLYTLYEQIFGRSSEFAIRLLLFVS